MAAPTTLVDVNNVPLGTTGNPVVTTSAGTVDQDVNQVGINGVAPSVGNGVSGTGVQRVTLASDGTGVVGLNAGTALVGKVGIDQTTNGTTNKVAVGNYSLNQYETVAASQTAQVLGATGATGDYLAGILIIPATTGAGSVSILDGATSISVFVTGTLPSLIPFFVPIGAVSQSGAWKVTTGANVSVIGTGNFT